MSGARLTQHRPSLLAAVVTVALVAGAVPVIGLAPRGTASGTGLPTDGDGPPVCEGRAPHPPIRITEDEGPQGFILGREPGTGQPIYRPGSGVGAGTGTAEDPYIIEGWCIPPSPDLHRIPQLSGLLVADTSAHVIVRDTLVDGQGERDDGVFLSDAKNVVLANNTITNNREGVSAWGSSNLTFADNRIVGNTIEGIELAGANGATVANNTIHGNGLWDVVLGASTRSTVRGNALGAGGLRISGPNLADHHHTVDASNTVNGEPLRYVRDRTGVDITGPAGQVILVNTTNARVDGLDLSGTSMALQLAFTENTTAANNTINGTPRTGAVIFASKGSTVVNNTIADNDWFGVLLDESRGAILSNNTVTGNLDGVFVADSKMSVVKDNSLKDNALDGVVLLESSGVNVTDNSIADNGFDGISVSMSSRIEIHRNNVQDNGAGLYVKAGDVVHAEDNWWGDASGPSGGIEDACTDVMADGRGDGVETEEGGEVCFDPWLESPNPDAGPG